MNPDQFEYTSDYLAHIAFGSMTNKYFEFTLPTSIKTRDNTDVEREKATLISVLEPAEDKNIKMFYNIHYVNSSQNTKKFVVDTTMIKFWKKFFGRYGDYDERFKKSAQDIEKDRIENGNVHRESLETDQIRIEGVDKRILAHEIADLYS